MELPLRESSFLLCQIVTYDTPKLFLVEWILFELSSSQVKYFTSMHESR